MSLTRGQRWARAMPDEVLLVQLWLSANHVFRYLGTEQPTDATCDEVEHLSAEVKRRGLQSAVLTAGRMMRGASW